MRAALFQASLNKPKQALMNALAEALSPSAGPAGAKLRPSGEAWGESRALYKLKFFGLFLSLTARRLLKQDRNGFFY